ncbi:hypothetical protein L6452_43251 [Arctium lappa]|uniref:Uncharacterized protein n=1 Tax=Arctium lappa TaxID=4217 RepID=A0ACB8XLA3_ARCLA|nr:hypothetical protein L6452_43251 [Arctium lappa]
MGKKTRSKKLNAATDTAKNPDSTPETLNNGSDHREPEPVVSDKPSKNKSMCVRRSGRLQSVIKPVQNQEVEEIDLVESEREEGEPQFEENGELSLLEPHNDDSRNGPHNDDSRNWPTTNQKSLDEKAEDVIKTVEIEALTSENHELARKLEIVLGKLEVYENINNSQMVIISNMEKAIEALVRPTSLVGRVSSLGGDAGGGVGGDSDGGGGGDCDRGGMVPKESSTKKRRQDQKST